MRVDGDFEILILKKVFDVIGLTLNASMQWNKHFLDAKLANEKNKLALKKINSEK